MGVSCYQNWGARLMGTITKADTQNDTKLPTSFRRHALGWLVWQHGLSKMEATDILDGISTPNSKNGRLRQEAIDVAGYIEHIGNAQ